MSSSAVRIFGGMKVERPVSSASYSVERPTSVDPLQPNITRKEPNIGGYHSRCSSAAGYVFSPDELSQVSTLYYHFNEIFMPLESYIWHH